MQELSGLTAVDASAGAHNGSYRPNSVLGLPGPEVSTFALGCNGVQGGSPAVGPGVELLTGNPIGGISSYTFSVWITSGQYVGAPVNIINDGVLTSRGLGVYRDVDVIHLQFGGIGTLSTGASLSAGLWHNLVFTITPSVSENVYIDGALVFTTAAGIPIFPLAGDPLRVMGATPDILCHAAFWLRALTAAQVALLFSGRVNPQESNFTGRALTDIDLGVITDLLNQILKSVRKAY